MSRRPCAWAKLCTSPEAPLTLAWAACKEKVGGMVASIITCAGGEFLAANAGTGHRVARARLIPRDRRRKTWMGPATPCHHAGGWPRRRLLASPHKVRHSYNLERFHGAASQPLPRPGVHELHINSKVGNRPRVGLVTVF